MNNDLISREALKEVIFSKSEGMEDLWDTAGVLNAINNAPTVKPTYISDMPDDVVKDLQKFAIDYGEGIAIFERKRPHGEWIIDQEGDKNTVTFVTCPFCGERHCCKMNFCGNCGADMRGDSTHGR